MAKEAKKIRIINGSAWSEGMEGEVFETYGTSEYLGAPYYLVDPEECRSRRFVFEHNCEVVAEPSDIPPGATTAPFEEDFPEYANNIAEESPQQADRIEAVCNEVRDLLIRKNHDYGDSFSKQFAKYGVLSGMIRMDDKMRRLETLVGGEEAQVAESIEDTVADLAGYALLTLVELRKQAK